MPIPFLTKKSAGVPVSRRAHRLITAGNRARDAKRWGAAADAYREALRADPSLYHIWVQLGHAAREDADAGEAERAYGKAAQLRPASAEPWLHLGHVHKVLGAHGEARRCYLEAAARDAANADVSAELHRLLTRSSAAARGEVVAALRRALAAVSDPAAPPAEASPRLPAGPDRPARTTLVYDVSDLIGYFGHARLPTGIQRVQIEAIGSGLDAADRDVLICCFVEGLDSWVEVPVAQFRTIAGLSTAAGGRDDPVWVRALNAFHLTVTLGAPLAFPQGACLVNLGTSWSQPNYFLHLRAAKARYGIRYIPFVYDLIPIVRPEHCLPSLTELFISWAIGVFDHADHYLVCSEATGRDLRQVAATLGHALDEGDIAVVPLDADFRKADVAALGHEALARWGLADEPFVLFVSTIESRKGHGVAFDAWADMIERRGAARTPRLVCVGNQGWLNDAVYRRLKGNAALRGRVTMLSRLSDAELALLYRSCRFTIYPSLYEGWGLPVTEALCYGKPVVASDSSSLPEAGGDLAVYVATGSWRQLAAAVERMHDDDAWRGQIEARIAASFRPRTWRQVAERIDDEIVRLTTRDDASRPVPVPVTRMGTYYPIRRVEETRIWPGLGSGEAFRAGRGWLSPEPKGCRTREQGGTMAIGLPHGRGAARVYLRLIGLPDDACRWAVRVRHGPTLGGMLGAGEERWIGFDYPVADDGGILRLHVEGGAVASGSGDDDGGLQASIGISGLFLCAADDGAARAAFVEAVALGALEDLNAYRDRTPPPARDIDWLD